MAPRKKLAEDTLLGRYVLARRQEHEWTLRDVAQRAGIREGAVWEIEAGRVKNIRVGTLVSLAVGLNVRPEAILKAIKEDYE